MVWQFQFKSVSPRSIVSEIIDYKKMFVQFGLEEENRHYPPIMNNVISGSISKGVSIRALEDADQWQRRCQARDLFVVLMH